MNSRIHCRYIKTVLPAVLACCLTAGAASAATFDLRAGATTATMPDGAVVPMWGFGLDGGAITVPGPELEVPPGDPELVINLTNELPVPVSIVVPGQPADLQPVRNGNGRVVSFTAQVEPGQTGTYTWQNVRPGTFLYHSGTHPAVQVQMGLYGALKKDAEAGLVAYPGIAYDGEEILVYSEIDPGLHQAVATGAYGTQPYTSTIDYKPAYFLVNGTPYAAGALALPVGLVNQTLLLRLLNAGLESHVPTLDGGYLRVIAEDGNPAPFPLEQYSVLLPAGKTMDVLWEPLAAGTYNLYDRRFFLTSNGEPEGGMLTKLAVTEAVGAPEAVGESYSLNEDQVFTETAPGILANETPGVTAILLDAPLHGTLDLQADGGFTYIPHADYNGTDQFTYKVDDGTLTSNNTAIAFITVNPVNDAPAAVADSYETAAETALSVPVPGVLVNDGDVDGDFLTATLVGDVTGGILALDGDGSFTYTPDPGTTEDTFSYTAGDGVLVSEPATVTIAVVTPENQAPVALDDAATTTRNTPVTIDLLANDSDAYGILDPATVTIVTPPTSGGTVANQLNGTVIFTPRKNFRGTDVFTYTVNDDQGATSNEATVRINVVK